MSSVHADIDLMGRSVLKDQPAGFDAAKSMNTAAKAAEEQVTAKKAIKEEKSGRAGLWASVYALVAIAALIIAHVVPYEDQPVLVLFDEHLSEEQVLNNIIASGGLIIERQTSHRYVLSESFGEQSKVMSFFDRLEGRGAFLILNGNNGFGCVSYKRRAPLT